MNGNIVVSNSLGEAKHIRNMLDKRTNIEHIWDEAGNNALHIAIKKGHISVVQTMIALNADLNLPTKDGFPPLLLAVLYSHTNIVAALLSAGANVNAGNFDGFAPIHASVMLESKDILQLLLTSHADINAVTKDGLTPLHIAVKENHESVAEMLLKHGANVQANDSAQESALHVAAETGNVNMVQLLMENGAAVDQKNAQGSSSLHIACNLGHIDVVDTLIRYNANINAQSQTLFTPLMEAIANNREDVALILLSLDGIDVALADCHGNTAFLLAAEHNMLPVVQHLVKEYVKAEASETDQNGSTSFLSAVDEHNSIAEHLWYHERISHVTSKERFRLPLPAFDPRTMLNWAIRGGNWASGRWARIQLQWAEWLQTKFTRFGQSILELRQWIPRYWIKVDTNYISRLLHDHNGFLETLFSNQVRPLFDQYHIFFMKSVEKLKSSVAGPVDKLRIFFMKSVEKLKSSVAGLVDKLLEAEIFVTDFYPYYLECDYSNLLENNSNDSTSIENDDDASHVSDTIVTETDMSGSLMLMPVTSPVLSGDSYEQVHIQLAGHGIALIHNDTNFDQSNDYSFDKGLSSVSRWELLRDDEQGYCKIGNDYSYREPCLWESNTKMSGSNIDDHVHNQRIESMDDWEQAMSQYTAASCRQENQSPHVSPFSCELSYREKEFFTSTEAHNVCNICEEFQILQLRYLQAIDHLDSKYKLKEQNLNSDIGQLCQVYNKGTLIKYQRQANMPVDLLHCINDAEKPLNFDLSSSYIKESLPRESVPATFPAKHPTVGASGLPILLSSQDQWILASICTMMILSSVSLLVFLCILRNRVFAS